MSPAKSVISFVVHSFILISSSSHGPTTHQHRHTEEHSNFTRASQQPCPWGPLIAFGRVAPARCRKVPSPGPFSSSPPNSAHSSHSAPPMTLLPFGAQNGRAIYSFCLTRAPATASPLTQRQLHTMTTMPGGCIYAIPRPRPLNVRVKRFSSAGNWMRKGRWAKL